MRQLMISLDKNILNMNSAAARRMVEYGNAEQLFIVIPNNKKISMSLSPNVQAQLTGGNKLQQFWRLIGLGGKLIKDNGIEQITTQDPFFTGLAGFFLKRKFGIKLEVQVHGDFFGDYYKRKLFKLFLAKFVINQADTIRVAGERIKKSLINLGIKEEKIVARPVPLIVKSQGMAMPSIREQYPKYEKIFVWGGRIEPEKNLLWLIEVFAEVVKLKPKYLLLLVGAGSQLPILKKNVEKMNISNNIKFIPWSDSILQYITGADCVLFPSLSEGYGLVPMEANAAGVKVIMNDVGVANYELKPSEKIKIISINDKEKWVEEILKI